MRHKFLLNLLSKKIVLCRPEQFPRPTLPPRIRIPANDTRGSTCQLAANQPRCTGQFVRDRVDRRMKRVAVRITPPAIVDKRPHSGDANRYFGQPFPPWTPETIAHDDCNFDPQLLLQLMAQPGRRLIRIRRQQDRVLATIYVRDIHAAIRTHEPMPRLCDEHTALSAHNATALRSEERRVGKEWRSRWSPSH